MSEYADILRQMQKLEEDLAGIRAAKVEEAIESVVDAIACAEEPGQCAMDIASALKDRGIVLRLPTAMERKGVRHPDNPELVYTGGPHPQWLKDLRKEGRKAVSL